MLLSLTLAAGKDGPNAGPEGTGQLYAGVPAVSGPVRLRV
jgi:hypothetical protein